MDSISRLLNPKSIAVVGASQKGGRGTSVLINLRQAGFDGPVFAVHPHYDEVRGYRCYRTVRDLPTIVDCLVAAVAAETACAVLEDAYSHGVRAAVVLGGGFGEGGHGKSRAWRLQALADQGMAICGPNCYGALAVKTGASAFNGQLPRVLIPGPVALISQSGGLSGDALISLMEDRGLGFSYVVSCGNQIGTKIEDYLEYIVADPDVTTIAVIFEALSDRHKLLRVAEQAAIARKTIVFFQAGRSKAAKAMVQSHTGALVENTDILSAFFRRAGIIQVNCYDELLETIEMFAVAPRDEHLGREVIVITGSGGDAAIAADALSDAGMTLAPLHASTNEAIGAALPEFGSVTNPIDGTGSLYQEPMLLDQLLAAVLAQPGRPILAVNISARPLPVDVMHRFATTVAEAARSAKRTFVGFQISPLGGPLDRQVIDPLHAAGVPLLLGTTIAMRCLRNFATRQEIWDRYAGSGVKSETQSRARTSDVAIDPDFLSIRRLLKDAGVEIVETECATSSEEAVAIFQAFGRAVAVKAADVKLLHKSDVGCIRLHCGTEQCVREAYHAVVANAQKAGVEDYRRVLVQPMITGVAEVYSGIMNDAVFGPAVSFGTGGALIEVIDDITIEMAPLSISDARRMALRIKGFPMLDGARGRHKGDVPALATLLSRLSEFAVENVGRFRSLDLNPIIVLAEGKGVLAVDIAVEGFAEATTATHGRRTEE